jgi:CheY-like chemotaxis protein
MQVTPLRVFMVEDARNMQVLMEELFATLGDAVLAGCANTEAEAVFWLEHHRADWDLLVLDLVLAQGSGINVIARARKASPHGKIAVFSGYASAGIAEHCRRLGADAVFDKANTEPFVQWLFELLAARQAAHPPEDT